ncbi:MAG: 3-dehydroquinate synthase, partial [Hymenobacteraceae bacterium]|nr:3-dehydroquinate synthase [Hymenobacteraceae bacterium]
YSHLKDMITEAERDEALALLQELGFALYVPELSQQDVSGHLAVIAGLREFREHLGGQLTIMLLRHIGVGEEVHEMDEQLVQKAIGFLQQKHQPQHISQV